MAAPEKSGAAFFFALFGVTRTVGVFLKLFSTRLLYEQPSSATSKSSPKIPDSFSKH
jgi:hypothetical protein